MHGRERKEQEESPPQSMGAKWPLPPASAGHRALTMLDFVVELVIGLASGGLGGGAISRTANSTRVLNTLAQGEEHTFTAAVFGAPSWFPRFPGSGILTLSMGSVRYSQGVEREIPVAALTPRRVHAPGTVPTPLRLPRSWWVLEVDAPQGDAFIAAPLDELALPGAVAAWPVPFGWPHTNGT